MIIDQDYLEHFGVQGMKWGVRREANRNARSKRLKDGTATKRDKLIREADLDGGRTEKIRKGEIKPMSKAERIGLAFVSVALMTYGAKSLIDIKNSL